MAQEIRNETAKEMHIPPRMFYDYVCRKCLSSDVRVSRIRSLAEALISPLFVMYRCMECGKRQPKLRTVKVGEDQGRAKARFRAT